MFTRQWRPVRAEGVRFRLGLFLAGFLAGTVSAAYKPGPGDELFADTPVRHLRIEISRSGMETLRGYSFRRGNESERASAPATVREGDKVWTNVAVHLKGQLGSFRPVDSKPALTLNFDKWADGQRFHGLQKISLNNSVQDPSYLNEKICRELYHAAGVPTPRADYATVELNGRFLGLYVLVEGWNRQFLKRHFENVEGNFYDFGGARDVDRPLPANFGQDPTNHAMLNAVKSAATEKDPARRLTRLRQTVDLDRFLSLNALDVMMWNWDGYAMNRNNYRLFHDLKANRLVFFPHGVDQMFWKPDGPIVTGRSGLVIRSLLETAEGRALYLHRFGELRTNVFDVKAITNRIAALSSRLMPAVMKNGLAEAGRFQAMVNIFQNRILARTRDVDEQLRGIQGLVRLGLNESLPLTNWTQRPWLGSILFDRDGAAGDALHLKVRNETSAGAWNTTLWLEEGRYLIEGRVRTRGVTGALRNEPGGAGFRVWSDRKDTKGASWGWFPYGSNVDPQMGGLIPAMTNAVTQRLTGDTEWQTVRHEFELRQPIADLQIQCALLAGGGEAWFDPASIKIRRTAMTVGKAAPGTRGE